LKRLRLPPGAIAALAVVAIGISAGAVGYVSAAPDEPPTIVADLPDTSGGVRGVVQSLNGDELTLTTGDGRQALRLSQSARIETLRPVPLSAIRTGDWVNAGAVPHAQTIFALLGLVVLPQGSFEAPAR
jgi:hypothetical protein